MCRFNTSNYLCIFILLISVNLFLFAEFAKGEAISFKADKPIASAELDLEDASFEKLKSLMQKPPARPASIFLKVVKSPNISSGEVLMPRQNFAFQVYDIVIRYPIL